MLDLLTRKMIEYYKGDPKRIQHFIKVHSFAALIGKSEGLRENELFTLEAAALVHDIGIKQAERLYSECGGKLQEKLGPPEAREMLTTLGFDRAVTDRVCYMVSRHHTYTDIDGTDMQILIEADFLVNLYEDNTSPDGVISAYNKIFRTESGKRLCREMFGIDE
ncbi:MAG: HD domain-containing protein [Oscillospiraceae bacterium]